jgi:hypothetical protein
MTLRLCSLIATSGVALALQCYSPIANAQTPAPQPGPFARMVVIQPHPGKAADFNDGYQRHLQWHKNAGDRWTWYGWNFVLGERLGKFMDGTFHHAAANFDHPVQPAEDRADNEKNVEPHAKFETHGIYVRLEQYSAGTPLPDASPFLAMTTYFVDPGRVKEFETLLAEHARANRQSGQRYSWYRLSLGGEAPQYVLMRAVSSFGAAAQLNNSFDAQLPTGRAGIILRSRSELLAFAPKLSYQPD